MILLDEIRLPLVSLPFAKPTIKLVGKWTDETQKYGRLQSMKLFIFLNFQKV